MPWFDRATSRLPRNSVLGSCTDGLEQQLALLVSPLQGRASPAALRGQSTDSGKASPGKLTVALILERLPVVTPEPSAWAVEHHKWLSDLDNRKRAEKPRHWIDTEKEADEVTSARQWQAADRTTDADRSNDTKSLWRCLDQRLYFVIGGNGKPFSFPERHHAAGETMRAAAERVLQESAQPEAALQTYFLGNGPICHWARNDSPLFFHKAQLIRGSLTSAASSTDYAWLSKAEVLAQTRDDVLRDLFDKVL